MEIPTTRSTAVDFIWEITTATINKIYSAPSRELLQSVLDICTTADPSELRLLFQNLESNSMGGELANILCNETKHSEIVFTAVRRDETMTLFRNKILIAHVVWAEFTFPSGIYIFYK